MPIDWLLLIQIAIDDLCPLSGAHFLVPFMGCSLTSKKHMTTLTNPSAALVSEFCGGTSSTMDVAMMIGVGLVKDSDAVFFQYLGEDQKPRALTIPTSGKPV